MHAPGAVTRTSWQQSSTCGCMHELKGPNTCTGQEKKSCIIEQAMKAGWTAHAESTAHPLTSRLRKALKPFFLSCKAKAVGSLTTSAPLFSLPCAGQHSRGFSWHCQAYLNLLDTRAQGRLRGLLGHGLAPLEELDNKHLESLYACCYLVCV